VVYNNVVVGAGNFGITVNVRPTPLATDIVNQGFVGGTTIVNNTFVNATAGAITEYVNAAKGNVFYNNLIVGGNVTTWNQLQSGTDWMVANNLVFATATAAGFVDAANKDFHLAAGSSALGLGRDVSTYG